MPQTNIPLQLIAGQFWNWTDERPDELSTQWTWAAKYVFVGADQFDISGSLAGPTYIFEKRPSESTKIKAGFYTFHRVWNNQQSSPNDQSIVDISGRVEIVENPALLQGTPKYFARLLALLPLLWLLPGAAFAQDQFLPPKQAFKPSATVVNGALTVRYEIAPGYYLYRDRLGFESATPGVTVGPASFPVGEDHEDEYFGKQVVYRGTPVIGVQLAFDGQPRDFDLKLKLQGCADAGLCYPPQTWTISVPTPISDAPAASASATTTAPSRPGFSLKSLLGPSDSATRGCTGY